MKYRNEYYNLLIKFEKYSHKKLFKHHNISSNEYNKNLISSIIYNEKLHIVSCFKEFLIFYDPGEFLANFYKLNDSQNKIKTYSEFYSLNSRIFPNYILLSESKYIFNNIKKKQKLLDNMEDNKDYMKNNNNENSQDIIMNYSDINNAVSLQLNNHSQNSNFSTIFTPSIVNSIINDFNTSIKNDDNNSNISKVNFIIDNINKNMKNKGNFSMYKTPKNKNLINNESENKKKTISSIELFTIDKNKINNSTNNNKSKNRIIQNITKEKEKDKDKNKEKNNINNNKKNKEKLTDTEISNNDLKKNMKNNRQQNARKKSKNNNIHKKTQSNENIRNDIKIFKDNETLNNKISLLLKTNCDIKSLKNTCYQDSNNLNKNKKNNNLQRYIQHITSISKGFEKNSINKTTVKNNKIALKKSTTSKTNTTYTNKTQSQQSISNRHKKASTIAKSMPKLPTSFEKKNKKKNSKNIFHNQLFNFQSNYQSLKINNLSCNQKIKNSKNKISNRKHSYKIKKIQKIKV